MHQRLFGTAKDLLLTFVMNWCDDALTTTGCEFILTPSLVFRTGHDNGVARYVCLCSESVQTLESSSTFPGDSMEQVKPGMA
jgi:hypothetical protein